MVSIMPGMDALEPERTLTSSGLSLSPAFAAGLLGFGKILVNLLFYLVAYSFALGIIVGAGFGSDE